VIEGKNQEKQYLAIFILKYHLYKKEKNIKSLLNVTCKTIASLIFR